ncbi:phosphonate C-P lyase system protein PhnG [Gordonia sp. CNJ-863]|uniref:phosphonate C-P lyase system protein PhnG n=1 Tax=Gordonia sp. CNJ-863 TaxID=1904963 RepID=UPI001C9E8BE2|nr:phosphonate C-P lyase system protein PhnG [Gordonia sp. CNJ-863]
MRSDPHSHRFHTPRRTDDCDDRSQRRGRRRPSRHRATELDAHARILTRRGRRGAWHQWEPKPAVQEIRSPETGLVMLRARIDSVGDRFNVGEATVTRATVRLHGAPLSADAVGSAYILGTNRDHAHAAACFDALLCDDTERARVLAEVVEPMRKAADDLDTARRAEARSTLVDFFNVSREHE